jgi:hypothetical protein
VCAALRVRNPGLLREMLIGAVAVTLQDSVIPPRQDKCCFNVLYREAG